jgi:hypothetical protein
MSFVKMNGYERLLYPARIFLLKYLLDNETVGFQKFKKEFGMKDGSLVKHEKSRGDGFNNYEERVL